MAQGMGHAGRANPQSYDEYLKAYSVAMLPGKERENLSFGGKIIMPPSALAHLTALDLESPWMFKLRNPANPAASTHAGVLEFIAQEGVVHLPYWMMKTLRLNEGDPIRITGTELPKGKMVKLQAQTVHFLEVSDPKAVLEQALRHFSCLTQGDIVEIIYNSIVFGFLVLETSPGGGGINVLDTDLEVDFAPPKGYVEPERPAPAPPPTMASKLKIDVDSQSPGSSRPSSSQSGTVAGSSSRGAALSKGGDQWESFKGKGETLSGRKTKGKGISHRKAEAVGAESKIIRTDNTRVVTNSSLESDTKVPSSLVLPFGTLFFGYKPVPYTPQEDANQQSPDNPSDSTVFNGAGQTLSGRKSSEKGKERAMSKASEPSNWGQGQTLGSKPSSSKVGAGGASVPVLPQRNGRIARNRSPSPDWEVDDNADDVIIIDSD